MTPRWFRRPLSVGDQGRDVQVLRRLLGLGPGVFDARVESALAKRIPGFTGILTAPGAVAIGESVEDSFLPEWFVRPLEEGERGLDIEALNALLGLGRNHQCWNRKTTLALRRWQSAIGFTPDGVLTPDQAFRLGNLN